MGTILEKLKLAHPAHPKDSVQVVSQGVHIDVDSDVHARVKTSRGTGGAQGTAVFTVEPQKNDEGQVARQFALIQALDHEGSYFDNPFARQLASALRLRIQRLPSALVTGHGKSVTLTGTGMKVEAGNMLAASSSATGGGDSERFGVQARHSGTTFIELSHPHFGSVVHEAATAHALHDPKSWRTTGTSRGTRLQEYEGMPDDVLIEHQNEIHANLRDAQNSAVVHLQSKIDAVSKQPHIARGIAVIVAHVREQARKHEKEVNETIQRATTVRETKERGLRGRRTKEITIVLPDTPEMNGDEGMLRILEEGQRAGFAPNAITYTVSKRKGLFGL